jgi:hypothetical protein
MFGASGLPTTAQVLVRVTGVVAGAVIIGRSMRLRRVAPPAPESMFRSRAYRRIVVLEVAALGGGSAALAVTSNGKYFAAWAAVVVGVHFLAFGRFIAQFWYPLGAVVTVGGIAGAIAGAVGGGSSAVEATSGLIAAAALFVASGYRTLPMMRRPETVAARH